MDLDKTISEATDRELLFLIYNLSEKTEMLQKEMRETQRMIQECSREVQYRMEKEKNTGT